MLVTDTYKREWYERMRERMSETSMSKHDIDWNWGRRMQEETSRIQQEIILIGRGIATLKLEEKTMRH